MEEVRNALHFYDLILSSRYLVVDAATCDSIIRYNAVDGLKSTLCHIPKNICTRPRLRDIRPDLLLAFSLCCTVNTSGYSTTGGTLFHS